VSSATLTTAGVLLITVSAVAFGGYCLLTQIARRTPGYLDNPTRRALWTAGHAHAGVLVVFALLSLIYLDQAHYSGPVKSVIRTLIVAAPILMPLGFFLSMVKPGDTSPNRLIWLTVAGGISLAVGTLLLGVGLL
jgi:RsiW-degrading membrane proteinase PrsW (M82 family)